MKVKGLVWDLPKEVNFFPEIKRKNNGKKSREFINIIFVSCHAIKLKNKTDSIGLKPRIIEKIYTNLAKSFFRSQIFFTE